MNNYNYYLRLLAPLKVYFKVFKKIISIVNCKETSDKTKISRLKVLLISAETEINQAEMEVIKAQFNASEDDILEVYEKVQVGSVLCHIFLN